MDEQTHVIKRHKWANAQNKETEGSKNTLYRDRDKQRQKQICLIDSGMEKTKLRSRQDRLLSIYDLTDKFGKFKRDRVQSYKVYKEQLPHNIYD